MTEEYMIDTIVAFESFDFSDDIVALEDAYSDYCLFAFDGLYDDDDWDSEPWFGATEGFGDDMKNANGFAAKFRTIINAIVTKLKGLAAKFRDVIQKAKHGDGRIWTSDEYNKVLEVTRKSIQDFVNESPDDRQIVGEMAKAIEKYFKNYGNVINEIKSKLDNAVQIAKSIQQSAIDNAFSDNDDSNVDDKEELFDTRIEEIDNLVDKLGSEKFPDPSNILKGSPKAAKECEKLLQYALSVVQRTFSATFTKSLEPIPGALEGCQQFLEKALQELNSIINSSSNSSGSNNSDENKNDENGDKKDDNDNNKSADDKAAGQYKKIKGKVNLANKIRSGLTTLGSLIMSGPKKVGKVITSTGEAIKEKAAEFKENVETSKGEDFYYKKFKGKSTKELQEIIDQAKADIDKYKGKDDDDSKQRVTEAKNRLNGASKVMAKGKTNDEDEEKEKNEDQNETPGLKAAKTDKHGNVDVEEERKKSSDEDDGSDDDKYGMSDKQFSDKMRDELSTPRKALADNPEKALAFSKQAKKEIEDAERALEKVTDKKKRQELNFKIEVQRRIIAECKDKTSEVSSNILKKTSVADILGLSGDEYCKAVDKKIASTYGDIPEDKKERKELLSKVKSDHAKFKKEVDDWKAKLKDEPDNASWVKEYRNAMLRYASAAFFENQIEKKS